MEPDLYRLVLWFWYFVGVGLHILLRARASIAAKSNSIDSFRIWWEYNWRELGWRLFLDGVGLIFWESSLRIPGLKEFVLPLSTAAAPVMGFGVDRFVDSSGFILGFGHVDLPIVAPPAKREEKSQQ